MNSIIKVYLDTGQTFEYECSARVAREHASEIVSTGYRSSYNGDLTWFPPHRIRIVKVIGGDETAYPDKVSGT